MHREKHLRDLRVSSVQPPKRSSLVMPTFEIDLYKMMHLLLTALAMKVCGEQRQREADPGRCCANSSREGTSVSKSWSLLLGKMLG